MNKADGAFLTISELANELNLPQHVLRYWETRFPQLKPLQRSGNRRYYRPSDVAIARRIYHLLHVEGFTVKGARKALSDGNGASSAERLPQNGEPLPATAPVRVQSPGSMADGSATALLPDLERVRDRLANALQRSN